MLEIKLQFRVTEPCVCMHITMKSVHGFGSGFILALAIELGTTYFGTLPLKLLVLHKHLLKSHSKWYCVWPMGIVLLQQLFFWQMKSFASIREAIFIYFGNFKWVQMVNVATNLTTKSCWIWHSAADLGFSLLVIFPFAINTKEILHIMDLIAFQGPPVEGHIPLECS